jgi:hypothetical protein
MIKMKYKLNIAERLGLLDVLPREGSFITLKIVRDLQSSLSFTEKELEEFGINQEGNNIKWFPEKSNETIEIEIGERAQDIIIAALKKLDESKKLTPNHFNLYELFVENK